MTDAITDALEYTPSNGVRVGVLNSPAALGSGNGSDVVGTNDFNSPEAAVDESEMILDMDTTGDIVNGSGESNMLTTYQAENMQRTVFVPAVPPFSLPPQQQHRQVLPWLFHPQQTILPVTLQAPVPMRVILPAVSGNPVTSVATMPALVRASGNSSRKRCRRKRCQVPGCKNPEQCNGDYDKNSCSSKTSAQWKHPPTTRTCHVRGCPDPENCPGKNTRSRCSSSWS